MESKPLWARKHDRCVQCGLTSFKHTAKGVCKSCYYIQWRKDHMMELYPVKYLEDGTFFGKKGILAYDEAADRVQCHLCGRWFEHLGAHVVARHRWDAKDYKQEFGLNRYAQGLVTKRISMLLSDSLKATEARLGPSPETLEWRKNAAKMNQFKKNDHYQSDQKKIEKSEQMKKIGGWQSSKGEKVMKEWNKKIVAGHHWTQAACMDCGQSIDAWQGSEQRTRCKDCRRRASREASYAWATKKFGSIQNYRKWYAEKQHSIQVQQQ